MGQHRLRLRIAFRTAAARRAFVDALRAKVTEQSPDREDELRDALDGADPAGIMDCRWGQLRLAARNAVRQWIADEIQARGLDVRRAEMLWHECGDDELEPMTDPETGEPLPPWHLLRQAWRASRDCSRRSFGVQRVGGLSEAGMGNGGAIGG